MGCCLVNDGRQAPVKLVEVHIPAHPSDWVSVLSNQKHQALHFTSSSKWRNMTYTNSIAGNPITHGSKEPNSWFPSTLLQQNTKCLVKSSLPQFNSSVHFMRSRHLTKDTSWTKTSHPTSKLEYENVVVWKLSEMKLWEDVHFYQVCQVSVFIRYRSCKGVLVKVSATKANFGESTQCQ